MANNKNRIKEKVDEEEKKKELGELRRDKDTKTDEEKTIKESNKKKAHPRNPLSYSFVRHHIILGQDNCYCY